MANENKEVGWDELLDDMYGEMPKDGVDSKTGLVYQDGEAVGYLDPESGEIFPPEYYPGNSEHYQKNSLTQTPLQAKDLYMNATPGDRIINESAGRGRRATNGFGSATLPGSAPDAEDIENYGPSANDEYNGYDNGYKNPYSSAANYGQALAKSFGTTTGSMLPALFAAMMFSNGTTNPYRR